MGGFGLKAEITRGLKDPCLCNIEKWYPYISIFVMSHQKTNFRNLIIQRVEEDTVIFSTIKMNIKKNQMEGGFFIEPTFPVLLIMIGNQYDSIESSQLVTTQSDLK